MIFSPGTEEKIPPEKRAGLRGILSNDPRPRYQRDPERIYGLDFAGWNVKFKADDKTLTVLEVQKHDTT